MKLLLQSAVWTSPTPSELGCIIGLLKRTSNIQSLVVHRGPFTQRGASSVEDVYSIIIRHIDRSKLRHLEVPIFNLNHVQMLSNRFRNLCSIRFCFDAESLFLDQLMDFVKRLMPDCSIGYEFSIVSIWTGQRLEKMKDSKSSTSYFRSFPQSLKSLVQ